MSKIIVIDKEKIESLIRKYNYSSAVFNTEVIKDLGTLIKSATEIYTDQSIEERAKECYPKIIGTNSVGVGYDMNWREKEAYIKGATEQSLIEQMKAKDLINLIGYHISDSGFYMAKYVNGGIVWLNTEAKEGEKYEYTTEELFNQFTNR